MPPVPGANGCGACRRAAVGLVPKRRPPSHRAARRHCRATVARFFFVIDVEETPIFRPAGHLLVCRRKRPMPPATCSRRSSTSPRGEGWRHHDARVGRVVRRWRAAQLVPTKTPVVGMRRKRGLRLAARPAATHPDLGRDGTGRHGAPRRELPAELTARGLTARPLPADRSTMRERRSTGEISMTSDFLILGAASPRRRRLFPRRARQRAALEREDAPGYHTTGRSAALYTRIMGRGGASLTKRAGPSTATRRWFSATRCCIARAPRSWPAGGGRLQKVLRRRDRTVRHIRAIELKETLALCQCCGRRPSARTLYEPTSTTGRERNPPGLPPGCAHGGTLVTRPRCQHSAAARRLDRHHQRRKLHRAHRHQAAGAWADEVAKLAGRGRSAGAKRRTAFQSSFPPA